MAVKPTVAPLTLPFVLYLPEFCSKIDLQGQKVEKDMVQIPPSRNLSASFVNAPGSGNQDTNFPPDNLILKQSGAKTGCIAAGNCFL